MGTSTVTRRFGVLGLFVALIVVSFIAMSTWTLSKIHAALELARERDTRVLLITGMREQLQDAMLAAMDSIVDKSEGVVVPERMQIIEGAITGLRNGASELSAVSGLEDQISSINESIEKVAKGSQTDLPDLIQASGKRSEEIRAKFAEIDDVIDTQGEGLLGALTQLETLTRERPSDFGSGEKEGQALQISAMQIKSLELLLAAMDSIIDSAEGNVHAERMDTIETAVASLTESAGTVLSGARTTEERNQAEALGPAIAALGKAIQTDLTNLITESGAEETRIAEQFAAIDDQLDEDGEELGNQLAALRSQLIDEQTTAQTELDVLMNRVRVVSFSGGVIALVAAIATMILIARSILGMVRKAIGGLTTVADQVSSASDHVASSSQHLAEGASDQAASLEETSASLSQMSSSTQLTAENANQAFSMASQARSAAGDCQEAMARMSAAMERIKASSDETAKIIKTIDEIAFQTNLLALNAAVEAARAGDSGKGFAVVAEEVRSLARRSADAARNTAALIERAKDESNGGVEVSQQVGQSLERIGGTVDKMAELVGEVSTATAEQAKGIEQVSLALNRMEKVTQSNAANSEQSAAASQELSAQAKEMNEILGELQVLVGGGSNSGTTGNRPLKGEHRRLAADLSASRSLAVVQRKATLPGDPKRVAPEQVIPLDEEDLRES